MMPLPPTRWSSSLVSFGLLSIKLKKISSRLTRKRQKHVLNGSARPLQATSECSLPKKFIPWLLFCSAPLDNSDHARHSGIHFLQPVKGPSTDWKPCRPRGVTNDRATYNVPYCLHDKRRASVELSCSPVFASMRSWSFVSATHYMP